MSAGPHPPSWPFPPKLLTAALLFALLIIFSIDAATFRSLSRPFSSLHPRHFLGHFSTATSRAATATLTPTPLHFPWLSSPFPPNFTSTLVCRWLAPAGPSLTTDISIPALDSSPNITLPAGEIHEFVFFAVDETGRNQISSGDYFETDISGPLWKSRPPVTDHGNGSYSLKLQVHPRFAGTYNLTIVLLFRGFQGLKFSTERFKFRKQLRQIPINFFSHGSNDDASPPPLQQCRQSDFSREVWSGRWTRHGGNDNCSIDRDGRYRCLKREFPCETPWCDGQLDALESNGWVYSAHCYFKIFSQDLAWKCLRNRWLFFWGDSNHVDSIRNMLNFVLGLPDIKSVPRRFDSSFTNPNNASESVRITSIFNGHWNDSSNYLGLQSLKNEGFRRLLWKHFKEEAGVPDTVILNSGLHDGVYWSSIRAFVGGAERAAQFWEEVIRSVRARTNGTTPPRVFYRTTIATGGYARDLPFNPSKMEAFNDVVVEKMKEKGLLNDGGVIDEFDMTFPWHYDNRCNDGTHYGRAPAKARWRDGEIGHQYFVDLMLVHVLLNAICSRG